MLHWYKRDDLRWEVTYQTNEYSEIILEGIFDTEQECLDCVDKLIEEWG